MPIRPPARPARHFLCGVVLVGVVHTAHAQDNPAITGTARTTLTRAAIDALPSSGTLGGLFETTIPEIISDRIEGGGLSVGSSALVGAKGSPWSQTAFQFGELDLTEAGATGRSLLHLDPFLFESVEVAAGLLPIEQSAPGVSVRVAPIRAAPRWGGRVDALFAPSAGSPGAEQLPPIATLRSWRRVAASVSGPLVHDRLSIAGALVTTSGTRFERSEATALAGTDTSSLIHVRFTPADETEVSAAILGRAAKAPFDGRIWFGQPGAREERSDVLVAVDARRRLPRLEVVAAGGYTRTNLHRSVDSVPVAYIDSVRDRPVITALGGEGPHQSWSTILRVHGTPDTPIRWLRSARAGFELHRLSANEDPPRATTVAETVEGVPARIWQLVVPAAASRRHATSVVTYASERIAVGTHAMIDAGVRWEIGNAGASGGGEFDWHDLFPRVSFRYGLAPQQRYSLFAGIARYGYRAALESLAYGDPGAWSADVFRWDDRNQDGRADPSETGPLIARAGGSPRQSSIDPDLRRPYLDELLFGLEMRPSANWTIRLTAMKRAERQLIAPVNIGAPASAYTVMTVPDAGADWLNPADDQMLPLYSRRPETFGADRYLLTNPADLTTTARGLELRIQHESERLWLMTSAGAGDTLGPAMAPGFLPFQNDRGIPGDLFIDPNAATFARGSYFADRNYTAKTAGIARLPHDIRVGVAARYQDGQGFSRLVLARDLSQGVQAVRTYRNGRTRFTYTLTLDARLQKGFAAGRTHLALIFDVFNLLNMANEVEEKVLTGPAFRQPVAVQPPRTAHIGGRITF